MARSKLLKKEPIFKFRVTVTLDELRMLTVRRLKTELKTSGKTSFHYWDVEKICQGFKPNVSPNNMWHWYLATRIQRDAETRRQITAVPVPFIGVPTRVDYLKLGRANKR